MCVWRNARFLYRNKMRIVKVACSHATLKTYINRDVCTYISQRQTLLISEWRPFSGEKKKVHLCFQVEKMKKKKLFAEKV